MEIGEVVELTIKELFDLRKDGEEYEIETPQGFVLIEDYFIKTKQCVKISLSNNMSLECSTDHLLSTSEGYGYLQDYGFWVKAADCKIGVPVLTNEGYYQIISIEYLGTNTTYDFTIGCREHYYYSNGILSHNTGKTAFVDDAFILSPIEYIIRTPEFPRTIEWYYASLEVSSWEKKLKAMSRKMFMDGKGLIDYQYLLGTARDLKTDQFIKIAPHHEELIKKYVYSEYYEKIDRSIKFINDINDTNKLKHFLWEVAWKHGKFIKVNNNVHYIPNNPNHTIVVVIDHIGLLKNLKGQNNKQKYDDASEIFRFYHWIANMCCVITSQFNRGIQETLRGKGGENTPQLSDFKESGVTQEDATQVIALFSPLRHKIELFGGANGYDIFATDDGLRDRFRSTHLLKNRNGPADRMIGMGFIGECGMFYELPKPDDMDKEDMYRRVKQIQPVKESQNLLTDPAK